jgi:hypothetical protein
LQKDEEADGCAEIESSLKKNPKSKQPHKNTKLAGKPQGIQRPIVKRRRNDYVKEYKSAVRSPVETPTILPLTTHRPLSLLRMRKRLRREVHFRRAWRIVQWRSAHCRLIVREALG